MKGRNEGRKYEIALEEHKDLRLHYDRAGQQRTCCIFAPRRTLGICEKCTQHLRAGKSSQHLRPPNTGSSTMKVANFHIEDKLRWLLPQDKRGDNFDYPFNGPQSAKHLIESVGIPHTEIGEIKADGKSVGLDYLVQDGESIEVSDVQPVNDQSAEPRFVIDCHLGRLAAYLRMLGLDSLYRNNYEDRELVRAAVEEDRILLSRDRRLLMHKNIKKGQLVRSLEPDEQFPEVIQRQGLKKWIRPFQRCIRCNHLLEPVNKEDILGWLQPLTRLYYEEFHICPACRQIYWKGSHYERMQKIIEGIEEV